MSKEYTVTIKELPIKIIDEGKTVIVYCELEEREYKDISKYDLEDLVDYVAENTNAEEIKLVDEYCSSSLINFIKSNPRRRNIKISIY